jgi:hypothetical protein
MPDHRVTKCAHSACHCTVEVEEPFCSAACGESLNAPHAECPCGHPECVGNDRAVEVVEDEASDASSTCS